MCYIMCVEYLIILHQICLIVKFILLNKSALAIKLQKILDFDEPWKRIKVNDYLRESVNRVFSSLVLWARFKK